MKTYPDFIIYQPLEDIDDYLDNDPDGLNSVLCDFLSLVKTKREEAKATPFTYTHLQMFNEAYLWAKRIYIEKYPALGNMSELLNNYVLTQTRIQGQYVRGINKLVVLSTTYVILALQRNLSKGTKDFLPEILKIINSTLLSNVIHQFITAKKQEGKSYNTWLYPRMIYFRNDEIQEVTNDFSVDGIERLLRIYNDKDEQLTVLNCIKSAYKKNHGEIIDLPF